MSSTKSPEKIGLATATIVGMNAMIGAGIFSVPAASGSKEGPAGLITYLFVIIAIWFMGSSMARLAQLYPEEGSFYTYASQWGGHIIGLLSAGSYLIGLTIAMGLLTQMTGIYLHTTFPSISAFNLGFLILIALVAFNIVGVTLSKIGQMILICCTVFPLLATTLICFIKGNGAHFCPFMPYGITPIFTATKAVIFGFFGFECAASLFSVVKDPHKNVPRALVYSICLVGALYLAFVGSIIFAVPLDYLSNPNVPLSEILKMVFPNSPWLLGLIHFSIISALMGTVHSMIWSASSLLVAYLKKFRTPFVKQCIKRNLITARTAIILMGLFIFIPFACITNIDSFFSLTAIFLIFAFVSSMITLLTLKNEWKTGQNIKTVIGLITAFIIFYFAIEGLLFS
jgi:APA family basic amino acid/polyamine antiporter